MVNVNPPKAPDMVEVDGQLYRPEDVDAAKARLEAREAVQLGQQDPTPIGVASSTTNRRQTVREQYLADGGEPVDPASTVLARSEADGDDPVVTAGSSSKSGRRAKSGDANS